VCAGLVTGAAVSVVTARVGEASNPQRKVLAASVAYTTGIVGGGSGSGSGVLGLRTSVTWTEVNNPGSAAGFVPAAPPLIPPLPADLFYPFVSTTSSQDALNTVSGAAAGGGGGGGTAAALLAVAAAAAAVLARA